MATEMVDLPIKHGDVPARYVNVNQTVDRRPCDVFGAHGSLLSQ